MAAKKTQLKLYKIDKTLFPGKAVKSIPNEIIKKANTGLRGKKRFVEQSLDEGLEVPTDFTLHVFHAVKEGSPGWVSAWTDILADGEQMLVEKNTMSSYITFIVHAKQLYALTGGQGNFAINQYVENFFGLDVIDHLIDSTQSRGLGEASKSGMTGIVKTEQRTFSDLTDAFSQDSFETFFRNLKSKLDPTVVKEYFGEFYPNKDYSSFFQGGNYFLLRKSIEVKKVFELIIAIEKVFKDRKSSGHNKLIPIGSINSTIAQVKMLNEALIKDLFDNQENPDTLDNYYFAPKAIPNEQIDGSVFGIEERQSRIADEDVYSEMPKVSEYMEVLLNVGGRRDTFKDVKDLEGAMRSYKIFWKHSEEEDYQPVDSFVSLNGVLEVASKSKSYLRFENAWYEMRQNFRDIINTEFTSLVSAPAKVSNAPAYLTPWTTGNEDDYNYGYLPNNDVLVAHKAMKRTAAISEMDRYVEYADLIHLDKAVPKLLHVKKSCNGDMRVAAAQVVMCAQKFNQDNKEAFLREYYQTIMTTTETSVQNAKLTEDEFVTLGMNDQIKIALVVSDPRVLADDPNLSVCGKFYFVKMLKDMANLGFNSDRFYVLNV